MVISDTKDDRQFQQKHIKRFRLANELLSKQQSTCCQWEWGPSLTNSLLSKNFPWVGKESQAQKQQIQLIQILCKTKISWTISAVGNR